MVFSLFLGTLIAVLAASALANIDYSNLYRWNIDALRQQTDCISKIALKALRNTSITKKEIDVCSTQHSTLSDQYYLHRLSTIYSVNQLQYPRAAKQVATLTELLKSSSKPIGYINALIEQRDLLTRVHLNEKEHLSLTLLNNQYVVGIQSVRHLHNGYWHQVRKS